ncbi:hypothetical protein JQ634_26050 [Bradyrhizobium sp. AUGA SZCCT0240]|uniref:hypothetical protein n=1 Tax=unclassified Bradyrhizobium TaxID=2631580 RepID=UPI001BAA8037|nr:MULTISPECIES: hypothetical protein [unclassified Bradyrhizobium]MBR1196613.1 hypothetical protein [Bradyrhizobium sp. AUGA SZCCT0158]MBR1242361.1 hypothetical protein [Bradyrhizobium sp. AUGA SZCCT0274]MBR1257141.1 hypothetical protein [Bradyrhizobium sp. AUGA SZCCT0240]
MKATAWTAMTVTWVAMCDAATATDIVIATRIGVVDTEIEMTAPIEVGTARAEAATIEATMMTEEATTMIALGGA